MINTYTVGELGDRPWGQWRVLHAGEGYVVKHITVNPGARLSLQYHHGRSESWTIAAGTGTVTNGDQQLTMTTGDSTYIAATAVHRIENLSCEALVLIEVQMGENLDEEDIVRIEDSYGRT
jgi:mannose-6-phosphate isomerase-like protein (cupin superfamily)